MNRSDPVFVIAGVDGDPTPQARYRVLGQTALAEQ
jgi:hypothetical protein